MGSLFKPCLLLTVETIVCLKLWSQVLSRVNNSDCVHHSQDGLSIIVRDQKTSAKTGYYAFTLKDPLKSLMEAWLTVGRSKVLEGCADKQERVFLNTLSKQEFTQQSFSKYMAKSFQRITGRCVNLQTVRRMVAEGMVIL